MPPWENLRPPERLSRFSLRVDVGDPDVFQLKIGHLRQLMPTPGTVAPSANQTDGADNLL